MNADVIVFKGIKFRRYPDSPNWAERAYYTPGIADRQRGIKRLHEELWMDAHGAIPPGCHIHHGDHDSLNNDLLNLVCLTGEEHEEHHAGDRLGVPASPEQLAHLEAIRPAAAEWHRSEEGREWHREHARRSWELRAYQERRCEQCRARYLTKATGHERFCSNACKAKARRDSGADNIEHVCEYCSAPFMANRYEKRRYCSRSCSSKAAAAHRAK